MPAPPSAASPGIRARVARGLHEWWSVLAVLGLLSAPLVVACVWLYREAPAPVFDMAIFEMRVRDVGTRHTPLVGLGGRLSRWPEMGSHLGPLGFYVLAPLYWMLGASYLALRTSAALLSVAASATALALARRRAGHPGVLLTGVVLALLDLAVGLLARTDPWNPYLPVPWVLPFLLCVASVLAGDVKLLPAVAAIGSFCAQSHISYLGLCGGLGLLAFAHSVRLWAKAPAPTRRREIARVCGATVALTLALWLPPLIDEISRERGNLTIVLEYFRSPPDPPLGPGGGIALVLGRLDLWFLVTRAIETPGVLALPMGGDPSPARGALVLVVWLIVLGRSLWKRDRSMLPLHATVAASLGLSVLAASRIIGFPYAYVVLFLWHVGILVLLSLLVTLVGAPRVRALLLSAPRAVPGAVLALVALCALRSSLAVEEAGGRNFSSAKQLAALVPGTLRGVAAHAARNPGVRYLVTWEDALHGGGQGLGLTLELERRGFDVAVPPSYAPAVGAHRVMDPEAATVRVHMANAGWIAEAWRMPGAEQLAYADLRSPASKADFEKARLELVVGLRRIGRADLLPRIDFSVPDTNVAGLELEKLSIARMTEIGVPAAVFLVPAR